MRVELIDNVPKQGAFALFNYSEVLAHQVGFIDILGIVQRHEGAWLDELAASHAALFSHMAWENKWVWVSAASRLDARPWGQEYLIKPLFFAAAVVHWIKVNPGIMHLSLVNCPGEVAGYLRDMYPGINVEGATRTVPVKAVGAILNVLHDALNVVRYHMKRNLSEAPDVRPNLVAFECFHGVTEREGYRYYFTSLLDDVGADQMSFLATGLVPPNMRDADDAQRPTRFVAYDGCSIFDILRGVIVDWQICALLSKVADSAPECTIGGARTGLFWQRFLRVMASRGGVFGAYLTYCGAARLMAGGKVKRLVFPYEEKGVERALIVAATEAELETLGFTPHPQHPLAISMRDRDDSNCPKPAAYAVCGPAYVNFFRGWANKVTQPIDVWGSQKGMPLTEVPAYCDVPESPRILLTLSHPNELLVFKSWLEAQPELCTEADIALRRYMAVDVGEFEGVLADVQERFPTVREASGTLKENVADCDLVLFCGTSAGLEAIQLGRVGVYVGLNDFFVMNPCFNDLTDMQPCMAAVELKLFLKKWRTMIPADRQLLLSKQRAVVQKLFSPIDRDAVQKTLS